MIVLLVMNFGKPQMERPASSVNAWFTGSWRMSVPIRSPRVAVSARTNSL